MRTTKLSRIILTMWFTLFCFLTFSQESELSPACWLRADSIRQGDIMWRDVSSHGLHATPQSGAMPDIFALLNFNHQPPGRERAFYEQEIIHTFSAKEKDFAQENYYFINFL